MDRSDSEAGEDQESTEGGAAGEGMYLRELEHRAARQQCMTIAPDAAVEYSCGIYQLAAAGLHLCICWCETLRVRPDPSPAYLILSGFQAAPTARHKLCDRCSNSSLCQIQLWCWAASATNCNGLQPCAREQRAPQAQRVAEQRPVELAEQGAQSWSDIHNFLFIGMRGGGGGEGRGSRTEVERVLYAAYHNYC